MERVTIFTCPKPFTDPHIRLIQRNALQSWMQFGEEVDVLLIGDDEGVSETAGDLQLTHLPEVERNEWGTPRVDHIIKLAREATTNRILAYLNADIILPPNFLDTVREITQKLDRFLMVGRRWDLSIKERIIFQNDWMEELHRRLDTEGSMHGPTAMDYFVFPREIFTAVPPFAVGRAGWDNWMVYHAQQQGWAVLDVTPSLTVIHQEHDYSHLPGGVAHHKLQESRANVDLGGGFNKVYDLLDVKWVYRGGKIQPVPFTLPRLFRRLERWVMPNEKEGWRWMTVRMFRHLRRWVS